MDVGTEITRRGKPFPAIDPRDGTEFKVLMPNHRCRWAHRNGIGAIKEAGYIVAWVLLHPAKIYVGIRRDEDEDNRGACDGWLCYSAAPPTRYNYETGKLIDVVDRVLLVFVNKEFSVYNWRWEEEDSENPGTPMDGGDRFDREAF